MRTFISHLLTALIAAIAGGIITVVLFTSGWLGAAFIDNLKLKIADTLGNRIEFLIEQSPWTSEQISVACPEGTTLVSGSCLGKDNDNHDQATIGPIYGDNTKSFRCERPGQAVMTVQATAVCFRVKK
jgi:hypothetical protein